MSVKWKTVKDKFPSMERGIKSLSGKKVNVGCDWANAWLAGIHEYGCKIPVTDKMRAYLHRKGLHLKASTKVITIPERSFLRSGFDENHEEIVKKAERAIPDVLEGTMSEEKFFELVGLTLADAIKDFARDLDAPPNHPFTAEQKGSDNPLVNTGTMIESITYEVK